MSKKQEEKTMNEKEYYDQAGNELLEKVVVNSELKSLVVNYVGSKHNPPNDEVTLEMVIETFAEEFKEFLLPIAEENFIRGYQQAITDVEEGEKFLQDTLAPKAVDVFDVPLDLNTND
jgi:hypothetical protein